MRRLFRQSERRTRRAILRCAAVAAGLLAVLMAVRAGAQPGDMPAGPGGTPPGEDTGRQPSAGGESASRLAPRGSPLDLDRTIVRLLGQADEYAAASRTAEAIAIWQRVLADKRGWLVTHGDLGVTTFGGARYDVYRPVHAEVERTMTALPADVIELYRRDVDGAAAAALRDSRGDDSTPLADVVRTYLLSSSGREAGLRLASYYLDRGEFVRAARVLERLRDVSAETSANRQSNLLARLAVAEANLGDLDAARERLDDLRRSPVGEARSLIARVEQVIATAESAASRNVAIPHDAAGATSIQLVSGLPDESHVARQTEGWTRSIAPVLRERTARPQSLPAGESQAGRAGAGVGFDAELRRRNETLIAVEDPAESPADQAKRIERWTASNWVPAGDVLIDDGRAFFKGAERLIAVDTASGDVHWMGLRNRFELTWSSQAFGQAGASAPNVRPANPPEIQRFGDRIHHSLTLIDGTIYNLEGSPLDLDSDNGIHIGAAEASRAIVRRSPRNRLAAYDAATGKLKWLCAPVAPHEGDMAGADERGFLSAPVAMREHLVAPASHQGEVWLYAIDSRSGDILWNVFLCDEPPGGCSPWAVAGLATDGGEVYVATGAGLVFAVDGTSGRVEWAVQYPRNGIRETQVARRGAGFVVSPELDGWKRDTVLVHGPRLIVTPSDYEYVIALDRRDGRLLWHSPRQPSDDDVPADVCLGIAGDGLFVAGRNVVRRYDLPSGRLVWDTPTGDSHGRGLLTSGELYMPVGESILRLDLETGAELSRSELVTASREPVGNLATDGQRLLCLSGDRLYALLALETHLERLASRIEAGNPDAQLERMRLRLRLGELDEAIADLLGACDLLETGSGPHTAARTLLDGLTELDLTVERPQLALELLARTTALDQRGERAAAPPANAANDESEWKRSQLLHAALRQLTERGGHRQAARSEDGSAVHSILAAAPLYRPAYLQMAARRAIAVAAAPDDRDRLQAALADNNPAVRTLALAGIAAVTDDAGPLLRGALDDPEASVRFEAAVALLNRGEREALSVFAGLLESPDVHLRSRSLATLRGVTGQHFGFVASAEAQERAARAAEWRAWIDNEGATAELRLPVRETGLTFGRTLISYTNNRLVELDDSGRAAWQQEVANPWGCQGLPNGHRLVASYSARAVYEYDAQGRLVWEKNGLPSSPYSAERLENGNTLVSCYSANKLLEFAPDGSLAHEIALPDHPRDARRLDNGRTLVALYTSQRVVEVDPDGTIVWEVRDMNRPVAVQRLDNGNTLVCQYFGKQVVEIDREGKTVWFQSGLEYPYDAQRLPTGNTLIVDRNGVQEVDPAGNPVWQQPGSGATSVWRY